MINVMQHSRWNFRQVIRLNINDTAHYDFKHISIRANIKNPHLRPQFWDEPPTQMVFIIWRLASCAKPELILWLWEKIRKSISIWSWSDWDCVSVDTQWCSATDGRTRLHEPRMARWTPVTSLRENLTQTHLDFSYFRTMEPKLTPALRKMPLTDLRHTIWAGDLFPKQISI